MGVPGRAGLAQSHGACAAPEHRASSLEASQSLKDHVTAGTQGILSPYLLGLTIGLRRMWGRHCFLDKGPFERSRGNWAGFSRLEAGVQGARGQRGALFRVRGAGRVAAASGVRGWRWWPHNQDEFLARVFKGSIKVLIFAFP